MEEEAKKNHVVNHFEAGSNCQVFNGRITGCVFAMPGSNVSQNSPLPSEKVVDREEGQGEPSPAASPSAAASPAASPAAAASPGGQDLCHFVHPAVDSRQEWQVHEEVRRLASRQGIQEICRHLQQMRKENKVLLPQSPSAAYAELVRMGMPSGEGFNESTFRKYYSHK